MTTLPLPSHIVDALQGTCIQNRRPAYVAADADGRTVECGGDLSYYGIDVLSPGTAVVDTVDFLEGVLSTLNDTDSISLPMIATTTSTYADIELFRQDNLTWIVLLDATEAATHLAKYQQNANELSVLRRREQKLMCDLENSRNDLVSVLNQLNVATAIVNSDGNVEFLSQSGLDLFGITALPENDRSWLDIFAFRPEDMEAIARCLTVKDSGGQQLKAETASGTRRRRAVEIDIRQAPLDSGKKILYIYDTSEVEDLREILNEKSEFGGMIGQTKIMQDVFQLVRDLAGVDATVLIHGETGTGKELVARAIHNMSARSTAPFIPVNCAGLNDALINSRLFGHKKGSFTSAVSDQEGLFEAANGGTLLLDEIGDIPIQTQTLILRALEQREITRVGETTPRRVNTRILAATNRDLAAEVEKGSFRLDLLYRIRIARVILPPLRERRQDISLLARTFLSRACTTSGKQVLRIDDNTLAALLDYSWPGNVRELENALAFAVIRCKGSLIRKHDLPPEILAAPRDVLPQRKYDKAGERKRITDALEQTNGNREEAARLLGMSRATFYRRLKDLFPERKNTRVNHS